MAKRSLLKREKEKRLDRAVKISRRHAYSNYQGVKIFEEDARTEARARFKGDDTKQSVFLQGAAWAWQLLKG